MAEFDWYSDGKPVGGYRMRSNSDYTIEDIISDLGGGGGGGDEKAIIVSPGWAYTSSTDYKKMYSFSIEKTGTYKVSWVAIRYSTSGSAYGTQLRVNDEIIDTYTGFALVRTGQYVSVLQNLNAGDEVSIYGKSNGNDIVVCNVIIKEE